MLRRTNRRGFLQLGLNTLASSSLLATLGGFERALAAADTSGYRALVCIYLYGGNDAFNLLVPRSTEAYNQYAQSRGGLAVPRMRLLPLRPVTDDGNDYGVHPNCRGIQQLFNEGQLSFVANVGSLVEPVTRSQYLSGSANLPLQLFSHEDQQVQWMTGRSDSSERKGWAGHIADLLAGQGYSPKLSVNISLAGTNIWQSAGDIVPYTMGLNRAPELEVLSFGGARAETYLKILEQAGAAESLMTQEFAATESRALELGRTINDALAGAPALTTEFPASYLGQQMRMAGRMIAARNQLGASRQIFFVGLPGFDTHDDQLQTHPGLLTTLSDALRAFYDATAELGVQDLVTTFTASEFGRTLTSNGDGTDHAWGSHQLVMGGAVRGKSIFGRMPNLTINGPDDVDTGRIIPTQAMDQYAATLSRWFGLSESDLDLVFPNLANFASRNLGFMG